MKKIGWTDRVRNEEVLQSDKTERNEEVLQRDKTERNEEVLKRDKTEMKKCYMETRQREMKKCYKETRQTDRNMLQTIKRKNANWIGHMLRLSTACHQREGRGEYRSDGKMSKKM